MRRTPTDSDFDLLDDPGPRILELVDDDPTPPEWRGVVEGCLNLADAAAQGDPRTVVSSQFLLRRRLIQWARAEFPVTY
jgi:hypothetical protein